MPLARHFVPMQGDRPTRRIWARFLSLLLIVASALVTLGASPASAATVYEITGEWEAGTPTTVASGDVVTAVWRVNLNDDRPAPSNDPVDNVTFTVTLANGVFDSLPGDCLVDGVTPASSISPDGKTLECNLGTHDQGTAVVVQAPVLVEGPSGSQVTASGSIAGQTADLDPLDIDNPFGMDIRWETGTANFRAGGGGYEMDLQWTLSKDRGSDAGPQAITYDLTIASAQGDVVLMPQGCTPFAEGFADGHPWSGGSHPANQMTSFVGSCQIVQTGPTTFQLTLTGINYDPATPPTVDSAGNRLPTDEVALASGSIWIRVMTSQSGSVQLTSSAPVYTSVNGDIAQDDAPNNTESKAWTTPGLYSSGWGRGYTGSGGTTWDNTYRVAAGTEVAQYMHTLYQLHDRADNLPVGMCSALDTRHVTFDRFVTDVPPGGVPGSVTEYYTGNDPHLDPASASYDPYGFDCGVAGGWSTTPPADPSQVKAVRYTMTQGQAEAAPGDNILPFVVVDIKPDTPVGTDIWSFMTVQFDGPEWFPRDFCITPIPDGRYPCTTGFADVLHVVSATPAIGKSVDRAVVRPGEPATYTLNYSANGAGAIPPTVDGFQIVDTLPPNMTYVPGSATPAPTVTTNGAGQQVLTWTLDGVTTNTGHALTYQAVVDGSATPGQTLTNSAVASYGGVSAGPARAQVTVSTSGYTAISKTADTPFIPNLDGSGDGVGSWTVTLRSFDPLPQAYTDTIDILPFKGDARGTDYEGSYSLAAVEPLQGQSVYYTTAAPTAINDDPADPSNGAAGNPVGNTVGWTPVYTPNATAIRVIGPALAPGAVQQFRVRIATVGADGEDLFVNRAQARAEHTRLVMRTSAPMTVANYYAASLKKYVQDNKGNWRDANDVADYPAFRYGDTVRYRIVVTNIGQGTITNLNVTDDQRPDLGNFHIDSLASGESESHEFEFVLDESINGTVVNTASATADTPADSNVPPTIPPDPAGLEVANYLTKKVADPRDGGKVRPGDVINYTISVTQQGTAPADAVFTDDLAKVLDDATYNRDATATIGTVRYVKGILVWSGTVPVGETALVTYSVTVKGTAKRSNAGNLVNPVTSPGCAVQDGETIGCRTEHRVRKFDLRIEKKVVGADLVTVGDNVRYRLQVNNRGPDAALGPITVTDPLPEGLQLVSAHGKGWECQVHKASDTVTCVRSQTLLADRKAPPIFVVAETTKAAMDRSPVNTARVGARGDTKSSNNRNDAAVSVVAPPPPPNTGMRHMVPDLF